jgi:hypothetical protein
LRIAVAQHRLRDTAAEDAEALCAAALRAAEQGAELLILPEVFSLQGDEDPARERLFEEVDRLGVSLFWPQLGTDSGGFAGFFDASEGLGRLGSMALLIGDGCIDISTIRELAFGFPDLGVLVPRSESDLQVEAMLEVAIALSDSFAGLIIVVDVDGAETGYPGHGGSAIVMFGKVIAEAGEGDDLLIADIETPIGAPEPREPLPQMPTILLQRLAHHQGIELEVDYPADLSSGFAGQ